MNPDKHIRELLKEWLEDFDEVNGADSEWYENKAHEAYVIIKALHEAYLKKDAPPQTAPSNTFKVGDKVRYRDGGKVYIVYEVINDNEVALGLTETRDAESESIALTDELQHAI